MYGEHTGMRNSAEAFLAERGSVEIAQAEVSGPCLQVSPKGGNQNGDRERLPR